MLFVTMFLATALADEPAEVVPPPERSEPVYTTVCVGSNDTWHEPPSAIWYERYEAEVLSKLPGIRLPSARPRVDPRVRGASLSAVPFVPQRVAMPSFGVPRPMPTRLDQVVW